ncbi:hypothetical protein V5799_026773, partial [Amblyomma americanum]
EALQCEFSVALFSTCLLFQCIRHLHWGSAGSGTSKKALRNNKVQNTGLQVQGAPAIAMVAALGVAVELTWRAQLPSSRADLAALVHFLLDYISTSRPRAANLAYVAAQLGSMADTLAEYEGLSVEAMRDAICAQAEVMLAADLAFNRLIGQYGAEHVVANCRAAAGDGKLGVLTHCNAGTLATAGYGTALGVVRRLHESGRLERAYCTETRPCNQGSRLTAYELLHDRIPATVICDSMVAALLATGRVHAVVVGADRVTANGDTANTIGTYQLAICAKHHGIPFYVASPTTTVDVRVLTGKDVLIEERPAREMTNVQGIELAPNGRWRIHCLMPPPLLKGQSGRLGELTEQCKDMDMKARQTDR